MNKTAQFEEERRERIAKQGENSELKKLAADWRREAMREKYVYNFTSLGRPIIQFPEDMVATQELIWSVKPDLIIETGIAHGGSLIQSAMMLSLLDMAEAMESGNSFVPGESKRKVLGIDIDIRNHNREAIEAHPFSPYIEMFQGSAIDTEVVQKVHNFAAGYETVLVFLDSMHTHDHVVGELEAYAPLVSKGSYCVVFDTLVEDLPEQFFDDRPWDVGDNPKTAVHAWMKDRSDFVSDEEIESQLLITVAPSGFLKRVV